MPYETEFVWPWNASTVILTGSFDNWSRSINLTKSGSGFSGKVPLPYGQKVSFKFIVDGEWATHAYFPTERDPHGNLNNILYTPVEPPRKATASPVAKAPEVVLIQPVPVASVSAPEPRAIAAPPPAFEVDSGLSRSLIESLAEVIQEARNEQPAEPIKQLATEAPTLKQAVVDAANTVVAKVADAEPVLEKKVVAAVSLPKESSSEEAKPTPISDKVQEVKAKVEEIPEVVAAEEKVAKVTGAVAEDLKEFGGSKEEAIPSSKDIPTIDLGDDEHGTTKPESNPIGNIAVKPEPVTAGSPTPSAAGPAVVEVPSTPTKGATEPVVVTAASVPLPVTPSKEKPADKVNGSPSTPSKGPIDRSTSVFSSTTAGTESTHASPTKKTRWSKKEGSESGSPMKTVKEDGTPGKKKRHSFIQKIKDAFK